MSLKTTNQTLMYLPRRYFFTLFINIGSEQDSLISVGKSFQKFTALTEREFWVRVGRANEGTRKTTQNIYFLI